MVETLSREAWTDLPNRWPEVEGRGPLDPDRVRGVALHWPGGVRRSYAGLSREQVAAVIRGFDRYHRLTRGWAGIGYCYLVDLSGRVWEGAGDYVAAHSATPAYPDANRDFVGVCLIVGPDDELTPELVEAVRELVEDLGDKFPGIDVVLGHRDVAGAQTECPGATIAAAIRAGTFTDDTIPAPPVPAVSPGMVSPCVGRVTSEFSWARRHPVTGVLLPHLGIDIAGPAGTVIRAAYGGVVEDVGWSITPGHTGLSVRVRNPDGERQHYGHLESAGVVKGQTVDAGDVLGIMGDTGNVTGRHLHFGIFGAAPTVAEAVKRARDPRIDFRHWGVVPGSVPILPELVARPPAPAPAPVRKRNAAARRDYAAGEVAAIQRALAGMGYDVGPDDDDYGDRTARAVRSYQASQLYAPGLIADGDWGPRTQVHYSWVKGLQVALNRWKGGNIRVDGDYRAVTRARVVDLMERNHGGAYKGHVDGIPGPVFCGMLGHPTHPGL